VAFSRIAEESWRRPVILIHELIHEPEMAESLLAFVARGCRNAVKY
jgi:hypothetical protein